ncbi:MAG: pyruvate, water dikinase regulatory protein [Candidatus Zhuqueibacterota bacterium]
MEHELRKSVDSPIYVVSGYSGASGEQLVHTVLAQFPNVVVPVKMVTHVRQMEQVIKVVNDARETGGTIVHTMVDDALRNRLVELCREVGVKAIDLVGDLYAWLIEALQQQPAGIPGLYRQLHKVYFDRVEAIEFSMAHDDGQKPHELGKAEIVLTGVSRVGKTPLSMYLAVLGWKVANVPLVKGIDPPTELFQVDRRRVIGLTIDAVQLLKYRNARLHRLTGSGMSEYTDPHVIFEEVEAAEELCRRHRFSLIGVSNKPIETSANEIIDLITNRFKDESHGNMKQ